MTKNDILIVIRMTYMTIVILRKKKFPENLEYFFLGLISKKNVSPIKQNKNKSFHIFVNIFGANLLKHFFC